MTVTILTHERRAELAARLLSDVRDTIGTSGVHYHVSMQSEAPDRSRQHYRSLACFREAGDGALLFLEDDVTLRHPDLLRLALPALDQPTILCLVALDCEPNYARKFLRRKPRESMPPRILRIRNPFRWGGSQAVFLPPGEAALLTEWAERKSTNSWPSDSMLKGYMTKDERRWRVLVPNVFQHLDPPSLIPKNRKRELLSQTADFEPLYPPEVEIEQA